MPDEDTTTTTIEAEQPKAAKPKADKKAPKAKAKTKAKAKGGGTAKGGAAQQMSVANHPRAGAQIGRAKAWGGLAGFALVATLSWRAHVPMSDLMLRSIAGGTAAYVVAWAATVAVWRHLVIAELRAVRVQRAALLAKLAARAQAESAVPPPGA